VSETPQRMVPRGLTPSETKGFESVLTREEVAKGAAIDHDGRHARALVALEVAVQSLVFEDPPDPNAQAFRQRAAAIRGACRNVGDVLVELASLAGELEAQARGI